MCSLKIDCLILLFISYTNTKITHLVTYNKQFFIEKQNKRLYLKLSSTSNTAFIDKK